MQIESTNHNLVEGNIIRFTTTGMLPTGLASATDYYVVGTPSTTTDSTGNILFFVSDTENGTRIAYIDPGTGTHSWQSAIIALNRIYYDILDDLDDTLRDIENKRRVIIEINYE